jgi:AcrR family transcriptional regulator
VVAEIDNDANVREQMILAAERLFALQGIEAVSLNRVWLEAGVKNSGVAGALLASKEALVQAILEYRMATINQERIKLLASVDTTDRVAALRGTVEALVLPIAARLGGSSNGSHYVRFLARLFDDPRSDALEQMRGKCDSGMRAAHALLKTILPELPSRILRQRFRLQMSFGVNALADWEKVEAMAKRPPGHHCKRELVAELIDCVIGMLSAPVSANRRHIR